MAASASASSDAKANGAAAAPVTVFVAGGTSNTGSATITALLRDHSHVRVRAGVRDVAKAQTKFADALKRYGAERLQFVAHDVKDKHLTSAGTSAADAAELKGVDTLLLVPPQGYGDRVGVATAYATAAKAAGVKLIAVVSSPAVSNPQLVLSKELAATEQIVAGSGVAHVNLRAVFFYENHWGNSKTLAPTDGSAAFYAPIRADVATQAVAVADIGEAAANVLAGTRNGSGVSAGVDGAVKAHGGKSYWIGGPALTHTQIAAVFSRALNKAVSFHSATDAQAVSALGALGWPPAMAAGLCELYHYFEGGAFAENTHALQALLNGGRAPTTLAQWVQQQGAAATKAFGGVSQRVFVAGAAGNTGAATVKALLRDHPTVSVVAGVRDAKRAETVFAAELADATLNAAERLKFAVHDVKVYGASGAAGAAADSKAPLHLTAAASDDADAAELKGVDTLVLVPPQGSGDREGVARAYVGAAKHSGTVKHVVVITAPGVVKPQLILTSGLAATERVVTAADAYPSAWTAVRPVFFFENHFGSADTIKAQPKGAIYAPAAADAKIPGIAVADIGEATANAATWGGAAGADRKGHWAKAYAVAGEVATGSAAADVFARVTGRGVGGVAYYGVTDDQCVAALTAKGWPAAAARGIAELSRGFESGAFGAIDTAVLQRLLNEQRLPTRLEQWLKPIAKAFTP